MIIRIKKQQAEGDFFKFYPRQKIKLDYIVVLIYNNITSAVTVAMRNSKKIIADLTA